MPFRFDHIVIGAGIVGSCTARQLQKKGRQVLLIEQFSLPHTRGSSHGQSRMIRSSYEHKHFAALMPKAYALWDELEQEAGTELVRKSGVWFLSTDDKFADKVLANLKEYHEGKFTIASVEELHNRFPTVKYPKEYRVVLDKTGGIILANKALSEVQRLFRAKGGNIWDGSPTQSVELKPDLITVQIQDGRLAVAPSLIVCAGAWTPEIFRKNNKDLSERLKQHLQAKAIRVYYWKCKESLSPEQFPSFIEADFKTTSIYGLHPLEYPGMMKVCVHGGVACDPDEREKAGFAEKLEEDLKRYVADHFPGLEKEPCIIEKCMYTVTPDENFVLDYLYEHKNVVLGCGFSGTGFKTAPIVGKILSEMALGEDLSFDVPEFKLARFS